MTKVSIRRRTRVAAAALVFCGCTGDEYVFFQNDDPKLPGPPNHGPVITLVFVAPLQTDVRAPITLSGSASDPDGDPVQLHWVALKGTIENPKAADTTFTCTRPGNDIITFLATDGRSQTTQSVQVTCK